MDSEHFKAVCDLAFRLTELRQNECKSLCVENVSQEILEKLLEVYNRQVRLPVPHLDITWPSNARHASSVWYPDSTKDKEADARCS